MFSVLFATLLTAQVAVEVPLEVEPALPKTAPTIVTGRVDGDKLTHVAQVYANQPVKVVKEVVRDGKVFKVEAVEYVTTVKMVKHAIDLKKAKMTTAGGKKLTLDDLKKRLEKAAPVVVSSDGKDVDASFLKIFDKDTIVIVVPVEQPRNLPK